MENIKELTDYTKTKKTHQLTKLERFYSSSIEDLQRFLVNEKKRSAIGLKLENLSNWFRWNYIDEFLKSNTLGLNLLGKSTLYSIESVNWDVSLSSNNSNYTEAVQFHKAIKHMAQALLLGWENLAIAYGKLLIEMLYGKQYKGWHKAYKHPWFMLEVFCKWQNIHLDYDKLNIPEDMAVYTEVIANWDASDEDLINDLVDKLCDYHIAQSDEDEYRDRTPDFPSSDYFVYAVEILLWLNIRSRMGLVGYSGKHPLMELAINNWLTQETEIPKIELVNNAKKKLLDDFPDLSFPLEI